MRLLRIHDDADGAQLELHPRMSVIAGLAPESRRRLLTALAALPGADADAALAGLSGEMEVNGAVVDFEPRSLRLLDLDPELDIVVRAGDLHGLGDDSMDPVTVEDAQPVDRDVAVEQAALQESLEELQDTQRSLLARRSALALALAEVGGRVTPADFSAAVAAGSPGDDRAIGRAATIVIESPGPTAETVAAIAAAVARVDRLRTRRDETVAAIEPLRGIETTEVEAALAGIERLGHPVEIPDRHAQVAADELEATITALEGYDRELEAAGQGPLAAYRRLDEAQRRFLAAEAAVRPPVIDPAAAEALEAAHDDVLAAEMRLTAARIPSKNLKKRLDDAVAVEGEILDRMGFATYTAFVMSTTVPLVSPELRAAHAQASQDYEQADVAFAEAVAAVEADPYRSTLVAAVDIARAQAQSLVGAVDGDDLVATLRRRTVIDDEHAARVVDAAARLRRALEAAGVDFGDLALSADDVTDLAVVWLAEMADAAGTRDALEERLRSLEEEVTGAELDLAQLETSAPSLDSVTAAGAAPVDPPGAADLGIDEVARLDLEAGLAEVDAEVHEVDAEIARQQARLDETADVLVAARARRDPVAHGAPGRLGNVSQIEWYLTSRLAAQQALSYVGSVPLVLDEPFADVAADDVEYLLERIVRTSDNVQVVFVGDDPRVVGWCRAADEATATLVTT